LRFVWDSVGEKIVKRLKKEENDAQKTRAKKRRTSVTYSNSTSETDVSITAKQRNSPEMTGRRSSFLNGKKFPPLVGSASQNMLSVSTESDPDKAEKQLREKKMQARFTRKYSNFSDFLNSTDGELEKHDKHFQKCVDTQKAKTRRASVALGADGAREKELRRYLAKFRKEHAIREGAKYDTARSAYLHSHVQSGMNNILGDFGITAAGSVHPKWPPLLCYRSLEQDKEFIKVVRKAVKKKWDSHTTTI
jgi:hypothetical protein